MALAHSLRHNVSVASHDDRASDELPLRIDLLIQVFARKSSKLIIYEIVVNQGQLKHIDMSSALLVSMLGDQDAFIDLSSLLEDRFEFKLLEIVDQVAIKLVKNVANVALNEASGYLKVIWVFFVDL